MKHFYPAKELTPAIKAYEELKFGVFAHFNMQQFDYTIYEHSQLRDPARWTPYELDVEQWFRKWSRAGVKYVILTARHTSDFCLWHTKTTPYHVMNSPVPTDIVAEFVKYARKYDIKPCLYYCLWGGEYNHSEDAADIILKQLDELLSDYGDIYLMWMDMANWMPESLSVQQIYDFIKERQPDTIVQFNQHIQDGTDIHYFPTDVLNGEERIPPETGHEKLREIEGQTYYLPFEFEICMQKNDEDVGMGYTKGTRWFTYGEGIDGMPVSYPAPMEDLYPYIREARKRGASNVLVSTAADHTGKVRREDAEMLCRIGELLRADDEQKTD